MFFDLVEHGFAWAGSGYGLQLGGSPGRQNLIFFDEVGFPKVSKPWF